jgi:hypothetical protein
VRSNPAKLTCVQGGNLLRKKSLSIRHDEAKAKCVFRILILSWISIKTYVGSFYERTLVLANGIMNLQNFFMNVSTKLCSGIH